MPGLPYEGTPPPDAAPPEGYVEDEGMREPAGLDMALDDINPPAAPARRERESRPELSETALALMGRIGKNKVYENKNAPGGVGLYEKIRGNPVRVLASQAFGNHDSPQRIAALAAQLNVQDPSGWLCTSHIHTDGKDRPA